MKGVEKFVWQPDFYNRLFAWWGYQWWSARAGDYHFNYALGHGGNLIVMLDELDMIIVTTADPLYELPAGAGWKYEGAIIDLVTSSSTPYLRSDEQARVTLRLAGDSLSLTWQDTPKAKQSR